jgi:hypothetical protein
MADEQKNLNLIREEDIPENWQEVEAKPIIPSETPAPVSSTPVVLPPYYRGSIPANLQHDSYLVGTDRTPRVTSIPIMPTAPSANPQNNAAIQSNIIETTKSTTTVITSGSGMRFRGYWLNFVTYNAGDVVIFNVSTYVANSTSVGLQPDLNSVGEIGESTNQPLTPSAWTLVSENLVFNGTYPAQLNVGGFGPIDAAGVTGASGTSATPTVTATSSGTFSNEIALVFVSNDNIGFTFTPPPGWNLLYNISTGSHLYWKPVAGGSTVTFTATLSTPDDWEALIAFFGFGGFAPFSITQVQTSPTVLTVTANNSLVAGNYVTFSNVANATFLNGQSGFVASASPTQFTINSVYGNPNYGPTADTGTASLTMLQATALVSGGGGPNAVGFTQATTKGSTFIYTDLWEGHTGSSGAVSSVGDNNVPSNVYQLANTDDGACLAAAQNHGALSTPTILPLSSGLQLSSGAIGFELPGSVQSTSKFLPYDVVEFRGSVFVCLAETSGDAFTAPANWALLGPATGFVQSKALNYLAVRGDEGNLLSFSSASSITLTLPNPVPSHPQLTGMTDSGWWILVQNIGTGTLTVSPNGLLIDGSSSSLTLGQNQGLLIFTDGVNYFTWHNVNRITVPSFLTASAPDGSGNVTISLVNQNAKTALMGPVACSAPAQPTFRQPQGTDFVNLNIASATGVNASSNQSGNLRLCGAVLPAGLYRVSMYVVVTITGAGNISMTITWNDGTASQTFSPSNISTTVLGTIAQFDIVVLSDGIHDISWAINLI